MPIRPKSRLFRPDPYQTCIDDQLLPQEAAWNRALENRIERTHAIITGESVGRDTRAVIPGETWEQFLDDILRICDVPAELYERYRAENRLAAEEKIKSGHFAQRIGRQYPYLEEELAPKNGNGKKMKMKKTEGSLADLSSEDGQQRSTTSHSESQEAVDSKGNGISIATAAARFLNALGRIALQSSGGGEPSNFFIGFNPVRAPFSTIP
ncbi:MAG: hypothetical protein M1816_004441 [Peltula sp. TS41687]|nr:MAG: hypothetical protein M1816_004441 [Peltula sp. TS41687]